jgi:hypothetical protein
MGGAPAGIARGGDLRKRLRHAGGATGAAGAAGVPGAGAMGRGRRRRAGCACRASVGDDAHGNSIVAKS